MKEKIKEYISGWELKKSLNLLRKSNAAMLERIQSPVIYMQDEQFIDELRNISQSFYSKIAMMHHYLGMAKKGLEDLKSGDEYKLKKFFYTLRAATVCEWIIEKEVPPPIEFSKVYNNLFLSESLIACIEELIKLKSEVTESHFHKGEVELIDFVKQRVNKADEIKNNLPTAKGDITALNNLFRKYIYKYNEH